MTPKGIDSITYTLVCHCVIMSVRSRAWVFTLNNPVEGEEKGIGKFQYLVYGKEIGESGTPHLQGYVYFESARTLKSLKKKLPRAHWEKRNGSHEQARDYCVKDGDFVEIGDPPLSQKQKGEAGKRVYEEAFELAKEGRIDEIAEPLRTRFYCTYKRIRKDYQIAPESIDTLDFWWFWGETGAGKSRKAREENPGAYLKNANKWWDGYVDQSCVIIDEWSPAHSVLASHLKQWADHHAFAAETKGGAICIRPKKIIVTSNYSIEQCFEMANDSEPLKRRFKEIYFGREFGQK